MRAFTLHHRDTDRRQRIACLQDVDRFLTCHDPLNWMPVHVRKRRRWRQ